MYVTKAGTRVFTSPLPAPEGEAPPVVSALRHAAADPDRTALFDGASGESVTRGQLAERSAAVAAGLAWRGIGSGDLIALAMPNLAAWPAVVLGAWRAGAAIVPLNPLWTAGELGRVLSLAPAAIAVTAPPFADALRGGLDAAALDVEVHVAAPGETPLTSGGTNGLDPLAEPELDPDSLAVIPFSSGTSGLPKGVRLTHANLAATATQFVAGFGCAGELGPDSVALGAAPFFHAVGLTASLCGPLQAGAEIVTLPVPQAEPILALLESRNVTHATLPLPAVEHIAEDNSIRPDAFPRLGLVATAGAHLPPAVQLRAGERLGCIVRQGYGTTETNMISGPMDEPSDPATVGWLAPGTEARLVAPETEQDVTPGEAGELWVRGPQVMEGYHGDPEATERTITVDGWLRTGDLVAIRDDGQLEIRDRLKELIKVGGASVAPAEVELVLREHPLVRDAGVVGRPDPDSGEVPVAHVVTSGSVGSDELMLFAASRLAPHKCPRDIQIVPSLPRLPSGKLRRAELRDLSLPDGNAAGREAQTGP
jgi:acyl-CoA synthetase (AMP-forming)/AMP-acid ligase II